MLGRKLSPPQRWPPLQAAFCCHYGGVSGEGARSVAVLWQCLSRLVSFWAPLTHRPGDCSTSLPSSPRRVFRGLPLLASDVPSEFQLLVGGLCCWSANLCSFGDVPARTELYGVVLCSEMMVSVVHSSAGERLWVEWACSWGPSVVCVFQWE